MNQSALQTAPTQQELETAFQNSKRRTGDKIIFNPEIKVKRDVDVLYIHEIRKTKVSLLAVVEVFNAKTGTDRAPMPLGTLSPVAQRAIHQRMTA